MIGSVAFGDLLLGVRLFGVVLVICVMPVWFVVVYGCCLDILFHVCVFQDIVICGVVGRGF